MISSPMVAQQQQQQLTREPVSRDDSATMQALLARRVSLKLDHVRLDRAIQAAATAANVRVIYRAGLIQQYSQLISLDLSNVSLQTIFDRVLAGTNLRVVPGTTTTLVLRETSITSSDTSTSDRSVGSVTGHVIDSATGKGLADVVVNVVGTTHTMTTKNDGAFLFTNIPTGKYTVSAKRLGYTTRSIDIVIDDRKRIPVRIVLKPTATVLSGIVTTATGQQRRVEVPNDIVKIDPEKIMQRAPVKDLTDLIAAAQVPGVYVQRGSGEPGAPARIRIRGLKSMTQSNDPVVIVDGNWIDATVGTPSGINDIDPATIESVEIVRGPSASTLYGPGAANGVIVITTKKGRAGVARWNTSYQRNWGRTYGTIPMSYAGFGYNMLTGNRVWCPIVNVITGSCIQDSVVVYDPNDPLLKAEGGETTNRWTMSVDGGTSAATYAMTATVTNTQGIRQMKPIDAIRYRLLNVPIDKKFQRPSSQTVRTLTTSLNMNPRPSLTIGLTVTGSQTELPTNTMTGTFQGLVAGSDRDYSLDTTQLWWSEGPFPQGRWSQIVKTEASTKRSNILLGGRMDWRPSTEWFMSANAGINRTQSDGNQFTGNTRCTGITCVDTLGRRNQSTGQQTNLTGRFNISKSLNLGVVSRVLDLRPSFGGDLRRTESMDMSVAIDSIPVGEHAITSGKKPSVLSSNSTSAVAGYYVNLRVGLFQRLYFDLGGRRDLGSALKSLVNGTHYPKLGGSYLISDEPFWPRQSFVKTLRLRTAVGYSAIQPDIVDVRGRYTGGVAFVDGQQVMRLRLANAGNSVLKPERVMEMELGFDADLFDDRVNVVATYAHSENVNAIIFRTLPPSAGIDAGKRKENLGRVRNRSVEMTTEFKVIDSKSVRLALSQTLTLQENVVTKLGSKVTPFSSGAVGQIREGYPIAGVWVKQIIGWRDGNGDGLLAEDEVILGDSLVYAGWSQPRVATGYGINFTLFGRLMFDTRVSHRSRYVTTYDRQNKYGLEDVNAPLEVQANELAGRVNNRRSISDVRWNSASVTWFLPQRLLRSARLRDASIGLKASNLGLWTNYVGRDPSVNSNILTNEQAYDNGSTIPQPRLFVLDFKIGL